MTRISSIWVAGHRLLAVFATLMFLASLARTAAAYVPDERWSVTASGTTGGSGTPATLTWSIAPDGTSIPGEGASNLISYFDGLFNVTSGGSDLTQRPWFTYFKQSFDRWTALGGITFNYEPHDNGIFAANFERSARRPRRHPHRRRVHRRRRAARSPTPGSPTAATWSSTPARRISIPTRRTTTASSATRSCTRSATPSACCTSSRRPTPC